MMMTNPAWGATSGSTPTGTPEGSERGGAVPVRRARTRRSCARPYGPPGEKHSHPTQVRPASLASMLDSVPYVNRSDLGRIDSETGTFYSRLSQRLV